MMDVDKGRHLFVHPKKQFSLFFFFWGGGGYSFHTPPLRTLSDERNPEEGFIQKFGFHSDFNDPGLCFGEQTVFVLSCTWNIWLDWSVYPVNVHFPPIQENI